MCPVAGPGPGVGGATAAVAAGAGTEEAEVDLCPVQCPAVHQGMTTRSPMSRHVIQQDDHQHITA